MLPKFHQYVDFTTRGNKTLDFVCTNISSTYQAEPRPHLAHSDHIPVKLIAVYRLLVKRSTPDATT